jgi:hypothetical protein
MASLHQTPDRGLPAAVEWSPPGIDMSRLADDPFATPAPPPRSRQLLARFLRYSWQGLILCGLASTSPDAALAIYLSQAAAPDTDPRRTR